jgi:hypothetical protein
MKKLPKPIAVLAFAVPMFAQQPQFLGTLSSNPYGSDSVSNPYGAYGSVYSPSSINNPYGPYGSPYGPLSVNNPYTVDAPRLYAADGTYLGKLSANRYDADSTSNPYGSHGSPYSGTSINNPFSPYGSPFGNMSVRNPYAPRAPVIIGNFPSF